MEIRRRRCHGLGVEEDVLFNLGTTEWEKVEVSSTTSDRYDLSSYREEANPDDEEDYDGEEVMEPRDIHDGQWTYNGLYKFSDGRRHLLKMFDEQERKADFDPQSTYSAEIKLV